MKVQQVFHREEGVLVIDPSFGTKKMVLSTASPICLRMRVWSENRNHSLQFCPKYDRRHPANSELEADSSMKTPRQCLDLHHGVVRKDLYSQFNLLFQMIVATML